jgi:uncharacterized membrane-anchored protein YitT (DUF2179 family)
MKRRGLLPSPGEFLVLTLGSLLMAFSVDAFLVPADLAPGGVTGIAIILHHWTGWPIGLMMLVLNLPMVLLGYFFLGRLRFLTRAAYVVLLYNLGVDLMAGWLPAAGLTSDILLGALYGGVLGGIGTGLVFRGGGTSTGTGILSRVLQRRTGIPISQIYLMTDGGVVFAAGLTFGWDKALYALGTLFIWGLVADYVLEGPSTIRTVFIVTDRPGEVAAALLEELGLGVTTWTAQGGYTGEPHTVLFCTVGRPDVSTLQGLVRQMDPGAFVAIGQGHQARGGTLRLGAELDALPRERARRGGGTGTSGNEE